jgi:hypothetical protein
MTFESVVIGAAAAAMFAMLYLAADVIVGLPEARAKKS